MIENEIRVLIVDDDKDDALLLAEVLKEVIPESTCHFERDGIAAFRYIKNNTPPDLIFLDLNMRLKTGLECLKDIFNNNLVPDTPVIIYSTSHNLREIEQSYEYGAMFYIVKPTCTEALKNLVMQAVSVMGKPKSERACKAGFVLRDCNVSTPII